MNTLRGRAAIVGVGESTYYKHGESPESEFKLALRAILAACEDAGIDPRDIDGFSSYGGDRNDPSRLAAALGTRQLRATPMQWVGGGGGNCAAVANGAAAVAAGLSDYVVAYRGLAQGQFGRYGLAGKSLTANSPEMNYLSPYGVMSPAQRMAMKTRRFMHEHGVKQGAFRAVALASYYHAQLNPQALMRGKPLDIPKYEDSRWIVEPYHLFDCCMENDGAAAVLIVCADRARQMRQKPAYILGAAMGADYRVAAVPHNTPNYGSAAFGTVTRDLYKMAKVVPGDVGSVQAYENFTGGVVMAMAEHGLFEGRDINEFMKLENLIAPDGELPLNTSGGNLAECYVHGMQQILEAVRQVRGTSTAQAKKSDVVLVIGAPMCVSVSNLILGSENTL